MKIQRPGIDDVIERDLAALALLANVAQRRTTFGQGLRSGELLAQFAASLRAELDYGHEADVMLEMSLLLGPDSRVRVPRVHTEYCTRRLLVQEHFDGYTVAEIAELDAAGIDRKALAEELLRSTLEQVLRIGLFHADPHPGNIFAFRDGTLGLIDFGAVGRLDPIQQAAVVDILAAIMRRDVGLLRDGIERVAEVQNSDRPEAARARAGAAPGRPRPRHRRRRTLGACRTSSPRWRVSASASRPTSSCCRARWSPSTARFGSSRPTSPSCPPPPSR